MVSRVFGNGRTKPMRLRVTDIDDKFIYCGPDGIGWKFRKDNGAEVDEEFEWGIGDKIVMTGSYILEER